MTPTAVLFWALRKYAKTRTTIFNIWLPSTGIRHDMPLSIRLYFFHPYVLSCRCWTLGSKTSNIGLRWGWEVEGTRHSWEQIHNVALICLFHCKLICMCKRLCKEAHIKRTRDSLAIELLVVPSTPPNWFGAHLTSSDCLTNNKCFSFRLKLCQRAQSHHLILS